MNHLKRLLGLLAGVVAFAVMPASAQNLNITGTITAGGMSITGSATNDNACTGCVGEVAQQTSLVTSAPPLVSTVPAIVTQVLLSAGDWDCRGAVGLATVNVGTATAATLFSGWTSTNNGSGGTPQPSLVNTPNQSFTQIQVASVSSPAWSLSTGSMRYSLSAATSVYLLANATFSAGTPTGVGQIQCRRMR